MQSVQPSSFIFFFLSEYTHKSLQHKQKAVLLFLHHAKTATFKTVGPSGDQEKYYHFSHHRGPVLNTAPYKETSLIINKEAQE